PPHPRKLQPNRADEVGGDPTDPGRRGAALVLPDSGPYEFQVSPYFRLNGRVTGISEPDGTFYRDVMPRHYLVTVDSYLDNYIDQLLLSISLPDRRPTSKSCLCGGTRRVAKPGLRVTFFSPALSRPTPPGRKLPPAASTVAVNCGDRLSMPVGILHLPAARYLGKTESKGHPRRGKEVSDRGHGHAGTGDQRLRQHVCEACEAAVPAGGGMQAGIGQRRCLRT